MPSTYSFYRCKTALILYGHALRTNKCNFLQNPIMSQKSSERFCNFKCQRTPRGQSSSSVWLCKCSFMYRITITRTQSRLRKLQFGILRQNRSRFRVCYVTVAEGENPNEQRVLKQFIIKTILLAKNRVHSPCLCGTKCLYLLASLSGGILQFRVAVRWTVTHVLVFK